MENREFRTGKWSARPIGPFSILSSPFPVFHFPCRHFHETFSAPLRTFPVKGLSGRGILPEVVKARKGLHGTGVTA